MKSEILQVENLSKKYENLIAVDGISFELRPGECLALLGPNGAGKTTTVEMLEGLKKNDSGSIHLFGLDLGKHKKEIMEKVGILLQETNLYKKLTVLETLSLFRSFYKEGLEPKEIISLIQLTDKENVRLEKLSGGQKQRVYIGCALVNHPDLLFLDEPTTGLDPQARRMIWELLTGYKKKQKSILLTTHYMDEAENLADRVLVIDHGKIIAEGSPQELISRYCGAQRMSFSCEIESKDKSVSSILRSQLSWFEKVTENKGLYEIDTEESGKYVQDLIKVCNEHSIKLNNIAMRKSTLEDVFIKLTGRSIRDA